MINCSKYFWYILDLKIKQRIITPLKLVLQEPKLSELIEIEKTIHWYNLPNALKKLHTMLIDALNDCSSNDTTEQRIIRFIWFNLPKQIENLCSLARQLENCSEDEINFDVTGDWEANDIIDAESLREYIILQGGQDDVTITNFSLVNGRLKCFIHEDLFNAFFSDLGITKVELINTTFAEGAEIGFTYNNLTEFNPTNKIGDEVISIYLNNNNLTAFNLDYPLPIAISIMHLSNNNINDLTSIDETMVNLFVLRLENNNITTATWESLNAWAVARGDVGGGGNIYVTGNTDSIVGTTLETTLIANNWNIL